MVFHWELATCTCNYLWRISNNINRPYEYFAATFGRELAVLVSYEASFAIEGCRSVVCMELKAI